MPTLAPIETKHENFGAHIGGSRADMAAMFRERNLRSGDLEGMSDRERFEFVQKDNIWPKIDYAALVKGGLPKPVAFYLKVLRDSIPVRPEKVEHQRDFVDVVGSIREEAMKVRSMQDVAGIKTRVFKEGFNPLTRSWKTEEDRRRARVVGTKALEYLQPDEYMQRRMARKMEQNRFLDDRDPLQLAKEEFGIEIDPPGTRRYTGSESELTTAYEVTRRRQVVSGGHKTQEEAEAALVRYVDENNLINAGAGKKQLHPMLQRPDLAELKHEWPHDYRKGNHLDGPTLMKTFGFRGGEFGLWADHTHRQSSLDMSYEGLSVMAEVLHIPRLAISLGGELAIAYGARGNGGRGRFTAAAHFEPLRNVINVTKTKGDGSLSHEWAHALDDYVGRQSGKVTPMNSLASENSFPKETNLPPAVQQAFEAVVKGLSKRTQTAEEARVETEKRRATIQGYNTQILAPALNTFKDHVAEPEKVKAFETLCDEVAKGVKPPAFVGEIGLQLHAATGQTLRSDQRRGLENNLLHLEVAQRSLVTRQAEGRYREVPTNFAIEALRCDGDDPKKPYFTKPCELFARAFESYVFDKIKANGGRSDYLVASVDNVAWAPVKMKPYPEGKEREHFNGLFDKFFEVAHQHDFIKAAPGMDFELPDRRALAPELVAIPTDQPEKEDPPLPAVRPRSLADEKAAAARFTEMVSAAKPEISEQMSLF